MGDPLETGREIRGRASGSSLSPERRSARVSSSRRTGTSVPRLAA